MEEIFVPVNRKKMLTLTVAYGIIGIIVFLAFYYFGEGLKDTLGKVGQTIFKTLAVILLIVFLVVAGSYGKKIKDKTAGISVNRNGITDQTTAIAIGEIKWKEVVGVEFQKSLTSTSLLIYVKNPDKILEQAPNKAVRRLLDRNQMIYKTPVVINSGVLVVDTNELKAQIAEYAQRFGKNIEIK